MGILYSVHFHEPLAIPGRRSINCIEPSGKEHRDIRVAIEGRRVLVSVPMALLPEAAQVEADAAGLKPPYLVLVSVPIERCTLRWVGTEAGAQFFDGLVEVGVEMPSEAIRNARRAPPPPPPVALVAPPAPLVAPVDAPTPTRRRPPNYRAPVAPPPSEIVLPEEPSA
jgi:hypothetical protein